MKLITRYNRYLVPLLLFLFLISVTASYFLIRKALQNELDEILTRTRIRVENYVKANQCIPGITSFDDQKVLFEKLNAPLTDSGFSSAKQFIPEQNKEHISRKLVFPLTIKNEPYKVVIEEPLEGTRHLTRLIAKIAVITIFATLLLLLLINRQVLSTIWRPFYESLGVIKSFKVNNSAALKLPFSSIEEFTLLNDHFRMAAGNAVQDYQRLKEFSENASHEIQTPLAIIRSNLDNMAQQESLTEKQSEHLQSVYTAVTKLSKLQQSLLLLTKLDNRQFHQQSSMRLDLEVKDKMSQFQELWQNKSITCTVESQDVNIEINKDLLDILLNNLFSNATRHNIENGSINIIVDNSSLSIRNTGNPPALDPLRIFQRFYKSVANSESNGLGLSIIKEICDISCIQVLYQYQQGWHEFRLIW